MQIYVDRGLTPDLARQVAGQLMAVDALGAHARDELGIMEGGNARPVQAALASAGSFAAGASIPLLVGVVADRHLILWVIASSLLCLITLGGLAARVGGSSLAKGALRVTFWGALAMSVTLGVGALVGGTAPLH